MTKSVFNTDLMAAMTEELEAGLQDTGRESTTLQKRNRGDREEGPGQQRTDRFTDRERKGKSSDTLRRSPAVMNKLARVLHHNR